MEKTKETKKIHIIDDYYFSTDAYNFIISRKIKNNNDYIYRNESYYSNLQDLTKGLINKCFKDKPELLTNLEETYKYIDKVVKSIKNITK